MPSGTFAFDFNPPVTGVTTGTYTVPAGKYALVTCECENGGSVTLNSSTVIQSPTGGGYTRINAERTTTGNVYTVASGHRFEGNIFINDPADLGLGSGSFDSVDVTNSGLADGQLSVVLGPAEEVDYDGTNGGKVAVVGVEIPVGPPSTSVTSIWVKAGDAVSGTGTYRITYAEFVV